MEFAALEFYIPRGLWTGSGFIRLLMVRFSGMVEDYCLLCILAVYGRIKLVISRYRVRGGAVG